MNRACTCTLVKDGDTGNFVGRKGKKKNQGGKFHFAILSVKLNSKLWGPDLLTFCCVAWLNIVE